MVETLDSGGPPGTIVIFRGKTLPIRAFQQLNHTSCLGSRCRGSDPGQGIANRGIKFTDLDLEISETRPAQLGKLACSDDGEEISLAGRWQLLNYLSTRKSRSLIATLRVLGRIRPREG